VSEGNYAGTFSVSNCSASGSDNAACMATPPETEVGYDCSNYLPAVGYNHIGMYQGGNPSNSLLLFSQFQYFTGSTGLPGITCTFTVSDQQGHSAQYVASQPAH
jgi:hypothetical protein